MTGTTARSTRRRAAAAFGAALGVAVVGVAACSSVTLEPGGCTDIELAVEPLTVHDSALAGTVVRATVTDTRGRPVDGVAVSFSARQGGGTDAFPLDVTASGRDGVASLTVRESRARFALTHGEELIAFHGYAIGDTQSPAYCSAQAHAPITHLP